jgi:drug/metabolite transporter (DMT)-like permease
MNWFWISVSCSAINFVYFKAFERWGIQTFQAVAANYVVCVLLGYWLLPVGQTISLSSEWLPWAGIIGAFYIFIFWLIGRSTQVVGVAPTAIAAKLSMVIPVTAAYLLYNDPFTPAALLALFLAVAAIGLIVKTRTQKQSLTPSWQLPVLIFISAGIADLLLKHTETTYLRSDENALFLMVLFGVAGIIGWLSLLVQAIRGSLHLSWKSLAAGLLLGVTNFFSVYGILFALKTLQASVLFPLNNLAIILVSSMLAALLFRERLENKQYWGVALAVLAIVLLLWP